MVQKKEPGITLQPGSTRNLHNLDLLRTLAVTMVVGDHTAAAFFGFAPSPIALFGVYLFFLHTSLVLMWSLERQPFILPFYIRRIFRIYPLAVLAIAVSLVFHIAVNKGGGWQPFQPYPLVRVLSSLLLVQDFFRTNSVIAVFWTLSIEMQMYLVLPMLFFFASRERRIWQIVLLWMLVVAVDYTFIQPEVGNALPTVAPHFLAGVIAYLAFQKFRPMLPGWLVLPYLLLLLAIVLVHPGLRRVYPITLLLGLTLPLFCQITSRPLVVFFERVALYSYGLYVWHLFGIKLADHWLPDSTAAGKICVELLLTVGASVLGYHLVELPMMRLGGRLQKLVRPTSRDVLPALEPVP